MSSIPTGGGESLRESQIEEMQAWKYRGNRSGSYSGSYTGSNSGIENEIIQDNIINQNKG